MEKYIGTFADGFKVVVWSIDRNMAKFHLKDWTRLHGKLIETKKV
jgi:hypothetical protein